MMKRSILAGGCLIGLLLGLTAPLTAQTTRVAEAGSDNGFVTLYSVNVERRHEVAGSGESLLRFGFYLENTSLQPVTSISVSAYVYDEGGTLVGFRALVVDEEIPPGESRYHVRMTDDVKTLPGDEVVLRMEEIYGPKGRIWELPAEDLDVLDPGAVLPWMEIQGRFVHYKTPDKCIAFCDARETRCVQTCGTNGVQSFGCSSGADGTCTSSCVCHRPMEK